MLIFVGRSCLGYFGRIPPCFNRGMRRVGFYRMLHFCINIAYIAYVLRAYKYALFPSEEQQTILEKTFGCCRLIYNTGLETKNTAYRMRAAAARAYRWAILS